MPRPHSPDQDASSGTPEIVDGLVQLSYAVQRILIDAAGAHGLPAQQARMLAILLERVPVMAELARMMDLDKSSTTGLVERITRRGFAERLADETDGRIVRVRITDVGRDLARQYVDRVARDVTAATNCLSNTNRSRLSSLAGQVVRDFRSEQL
jgi:DNA-binding MarR family transcriptional regulator